MNWFNRSVQIHNGIQNHHGHKVGMGLTRFQGSRWLFAGLCLERNIPLGPNCSSF